MSTRKGKLSEEDIAALQASCISAFLSNHPEHTQENPFPKCAGSKKADMCKTCELREGKRIKKAPVNPYAGVVTKNHVIAGQGKKVARESPLARQLRMVEFELYKLRMKYDAESRARHAALSAQRKDILRAMCIKTR